MIDNKKAAFPLDMSFSVAALGRYVNGTRKPGMEIYNFQLCIILQ